MTPRRYFKGISQSIIIFSLALISISAPAYYNLGAFWRAPKRISLVGASAVVSNTTGGSLAMSVGKPTGVQSGDVLVMQVTWAENYGTVTSSPSGWSTAASMWNSTTCADSGSVIYYLVAGGSEPSSYSVTCSGYCSAAISAFRGVDNTTPMDAVGTKGSSTTSCNGSEVSPQSQAIPTVTTLNANDWVVLFYGDNNDDSVGGTSTQSLPAGFTSLYSALSTTSGQNILAGYIGPVSSGSTGSETVTTTHEDFYGWTGILVALKPSS